MARPVKKQPAKRRYDSTLRQEQAAGTRARIVESAADLFERQGYARTTIKQIAAAAGVSADTVYAAFGTKARVLTALIDTRLAPPDPQADPQADTAVDNVMDRPDARAVAEETDPRAQIALFAKDMAGVLDRVGPVYEIMRTASAADDELAATFTEMDGYRAANMRRAAGWFAANGGLRVDEASAADILFVLASPDVGRMLRVRKGWSQGEHADWLADVLTRTLLDDP